MTPYYKHGAYNAICDVCGFKFKSDKLKHRWDGLMVCAKDWEMRHPQDLIKIPRERPAPPWTRPEEVLTIFACSLTGISSTTGYAIAGCSVSGRPYNGVNT